MARISIYVSNDIELDDGRPVFHIFAGSDGGGRLRYAHAFFNRHDANVEAELIQARIDNGGKLRRQDWYEGVAR